MGRLDNHHLNRKSVPSTRRDRSPLPRTSRSQSPRTNVITFRLNPGGRLAYVAAPETYEQAVAIARSVYAEELQSVKARRIVFYVKSSVQNDMLPVQIGPTAWHAVVSGLPQYDIVDVEVVPEVVVEDTDTLPQYVDIDTKGAAEPFSRSPSQSQQGSREPSRKSPSPSPKDRVKEMAINFLERF
ncbi:hypothetical protein B0H21DRAFT_743415 [Amylocystis lapponica]|nr:hypothetical protein B0H21DRAFT_743415 [Amylocystis lapponica]